MLDNGPVMNRTITLAALVAAAIAGSAQSQEDVPEGHSVHGHAFNEGPRQRAYLMDTMNSAVRFKVTTSSPRAQLFIDQGVVQLHGFWYFEAERSFRQAASIDPDCAMAYWGMARANVDNEPRARGFAFEAFRRRETVTDRERGHIEALARFHQAEEDPADTPEWERPRGEEDKKRRRRHVEDLEALIHDYPEDIETKAFLVNQLWLDDREGRRITSRQANEALLSEVFDAQPMHPAHHYRVHLWDKRDTAHRVTDSAAVIGHSAPGIAHMWHMGGHTWARLDRHADAAWQQEASARVDHAHMMRDWVMPDQIHNYAHNNEWLCRSLRHVGRVEDAIDLAKNMIELPRHPGWNMRDGKSNSASYGRDRLIDVLVMYERWAELAELLESMYLEPGETLRHRAEHAGLRAVAAHYLGDSERCAAQIDALDGLLGEARADRASAVDAAEEEALARGAGTKELDEVMKEAGRGPSRVVRSARKWREVASGLVSAARGDWEEALAAVEGGSLDPLPLSRLQLEAGRHDEALKTAEKAARNRGMAAPIANHCYVLWKTGDRAAAAEKFEELRAFSAYFDLDHPVFERIAPLAAELGHDGDWRIEPVVEDDVGDRPSLDSLGPIRWSPIRAPEWRLPAAGGRMVSLSDHVGRPVIVVFFLGHGCVHCVEQLQAFKPAWERFQAAGIDVVAVGTDAVEEGAAAEAAAGYPFSIAADPDLAVFKQWRCYDDFEGSPLHGTFLLDSKGRIRWQDISYEPFTDVDFLLGESARLLSLPVAER